ncbi:MAG: hypothetical protein KDA57_18945 [Planctomycetales bacterium]|nr:hypothetical protein [Planctomycetales bacterium]
MKKLLGFVPALALAVMMSATALAEDGALSGAALQEMGLGGMQVMSDREAMDVRGKGFLGPGSNSLAFGGSFAALSFGNIANSGTIDGYLADGDYMAGGSHLSEAGFSISFTNELEVKGAPATKQTYTLTGRIYAGGQAMATSL